MAIAEVVLEAGAELMISPRKWYVSAPERPTLVTPVGSTFSISFSISGSVSQQKKTRDFMDELKGREAQTSHRSSCLRRQGYHVRDVTEMR